MDFPVGSVVKNRPDSVGDVRDVGRFQVRKIP